MGKGKDMARRKRMVVAAIFLLLLILVGTGLFFQPNVRKSRFSRQGATTITGNQAELRIWDYNTVDGDVVNIYFDGKLIFEKLALADTAVVYHTGTLARGVHWLGVEALDEGMSAPATPHVRIFDGTLTHEFDVDAWLDSVSGSWEIIVE